MNRQLSLLLSLTRWLVPLKGHAFYPDTRVSFLSVPFNSNPSDSSFLVAGLGPGEGGRLHWVPQLRIQSMLQISLVHVSRALFHASLLRCSPSLWDQVVLNRSECVHVTVQYPF